MNPQLKFTALLCLDDTCVNDAEEQVSSHLDAGMEPRTHHKRGNVNCAAAMGYLELSRNNWKRGVVFMTSDGEDACFARHIMAIVCLRHNALDQLQEGKTMNYEHGRNTDRPSHGGRIPPAIASNCSGADAGRIGCGASAEIQSVPATAAVLEFAPLSDDELLALEVRVAIEKLRRITLANGSTTPYSIATETR